MCTHVKGRTVILNTIRTLKTVLTQRTHSLLSTILLPQLPQCWYYRASTGTSSYHTYMHTSNQMFWRLCSMWFRTILKAKKLKQNKTHVSVCATYVQVAMEDKESTEFHWSRKFRRLWALPLEEQWELLTTKTSLYTTKPFWITAET